MARKKRSWLYHMYEVKQNIKQYFINLVQFLTSFYLQHLFISLKIITKEEKKNRYNEKLH